MDLAVTQHGQRIRPLSPLAITPWGVNFRRAYWLGRIPHGARTILALGTRMSYGITVRRKYFSHK
jgi:hypothetical protein